MNIPLNEIGQTTIKMYLECPVTLLQQIIPGNVEDSFTDTPDTVEDYILLDGVEAVLSIIEDMPENNTAHVVFSVGGQPPIRLELTGQKQHRPANKGDVTL